MSITIKMSTGNTINSFFQCVIQVKIQKLLPIVILNKSQNLKIIFAHFSLHIGIFLYVNMWDAYIQIWFF